MLHAVPHALELRLTFACDSSGAVSNQSRVSLQVCSQSLQRIKASWPGCSLPDDLFRVELGDGL